MIYITGDCHSEFQKFNTENFPEQKNMNKDDFVIICGDFGGVWHKDEESQNEVYWLNWLEEKPFTTLFLQLCFAKNSFISFSNLTFNLSLPQAGITINEKSTF